MTDAAIAPEEDVMYTTILGIFVKLDTVWILLTFK